MSSNQFIKFPKKLAKTDFLTMSEFRVFALLLCFNPCYPPTKKLIEYSGLDRKTVIKALNGLKAKAVITWKRGTSHGKANLYNIQPQYMWKLPSNHRPKISRKYIPKIGTPIRIRNRIIELPNEKDLELASLSEEEILARYEPKTES